MSSSSAEPSQERTDQGTRQGADLSDTDSQKRHLVALDPGLDMLGQGDESHPYPVEGTLQPYLTRGLVTTPRICVAPQSKAKTVWRFPGVHTGRGIHS